MKNTALGKSHFLDLLYIIRSYVFKLLLKITTTKSIDTPFYFLL